MHGQYLVGPRGEEGPGLWTGDRGRVGLTSVPSRSSLSGTTLRILSMPVPAAEMHLSWCEVSASNLFKPFSVLSLLSCDAALVAWPL